LRRDQSFGPDEADRLCNAAAQGAGLPGTFRAWISSLGTSVPVVREGVRAADRIADVGPWYLVGTDTVVFNNKAHLLNTPLVPIDINEHGGTLTSGYVWTGTLVGGEFSFLDCEAWQTGDSLLDGTVGDLAATGNAWTDAARLRCRSDQAHLYCIEQ
jgi:hypothetical protein